MKQLFAGKSGSCLPSLREKSASGRGIPAFIGKSSAAPTPAPHAASQSVGASRLERRGGLTLRGAVLLSRAVGNRVTCDLNYNST